MRALIIFIATAMGACGASTDHEPPTTDVCGWAATNVVSRADPCGWTARSRDTSVARLYSVYGVTSEPKPACGVDMYAAVTKLQPNDIVEIWTPPEVTGEAGLAAVDYEGCE